jgi:hypothetical protein
MAMYQGIGKGRLARPALLGMWLICSMEWAHAQGVVGGQVLTGENEMSRSWDMREVIFELIKQFYKGEQPAMDAVSKLAKMGRQAVPPVTEKLQKGETAEVKYYAAITLSRIRHPSAAEALLPILDDQKSEPRVRLLALQAATDLDQAIPRLVEIATKDPEEEFRFQALSALTLMPGAWGTCEKIFVDAFAEPSERFRSLALNACMQSSVKKIIYPSAESKLIEILKGDEADGTRAKAAVTLGFMKSEWAVKELMVLAGGKSTSPSLAKASLEALIRITGVPFRNADSLGPWWEKYGKDRYGAAKPLPIPKKTPALPSTKALSPVSQTPGNKQVSPELPADLPVPTKLKPIPKTDPKPDPLAGAIIND